MLFAADTRTSTKGYTDAQVTEYLRRACEQVGIVYELREQVNMPVLPPVPTQAPEPERTLEPATDVACKWVLKDNTVTYTTEDGKFIGQPSVRKALKARLRKAGFEYDADAKVWALTKNGKRDCKGAQAFVNATSSLVTANEIEELRAKAVARKAKRA